METTHPVEKMQVVGKGSTQLLFETSFYIQPPMSKIVGESYDVEVTDFTILDEKVLVKGIVEKTLYYKHPHLGKKGNNKQQDSANSDKKDASENAGSEDTKDSKEAETADSADESKSKSVKSKLKNVYGKFSRRSKKGKNSQEENSNQSNQEKNGEDNQEQSQKNEQENKKGSENTDEFKCLNGWGQVLDSSHGIVHFYQQVSEFSSTVDIPGAMPGDSCHIELAEVKNCEPFIATAAGSENNESKDNNSNNSLITTGTQMFSLDIVVVAARNKTKKQSRIRSKKAKTLPLDESITTVS
jgi:hypothetical protein